MNVIRFSKVINIYIGSFQILKLMRRIISKSKYMLDPKITATPAEKVTIFHGEFPSFSVHWIPTTGFACGETPMIEPMGFLALGKIIQQGLG